MALALPAGGAPEEQVEYDPLLLRRWLQMLLVAFYSDEEAVVAALLLERQAALRDRTVSAALQLPDRQVRQVLERRLVPDGLFEHFRKAVGGVGEEGQVFYRFSPLAVVATDRRLQAMEDALAAEAEGNDEYYCRPCRRVFSSLQALPLAFACNGCGGELAAVEQYLCRGCGRSSDSKQVLEAEVPPCSSCGGELAAESLRAAADGGHKRLQRFRAQCSGLLVLTRRLRTMRVPHFDLEDKATAAKWSTKRAAEEVPLEPPRNWAVEAASARARAAGAAAASGPSAGEVAWFHSEVFGSTPLALALGGPSGAASGASPGGSEAAAESDKVLKQALEEADRRLEEEHRQRLQDASQWAKPNAPSPDSAVAAAAAKAAGQEVTVGGKPYLLARVRDDDDLQDAMTDDEYRRFVELDRELERLERPVPG